MWCGDPLAQGAPSGLTYVEERCIARYLEDDTAHHHSYYFFFKVLVLIQFYYFILIYGVLKYLCIIVSEYQ